MDNAKVVSKVHMTVDEKVAVTVAGSDGTKVVAMVATLADSLDDMMVYSMVGWMALCLAVTWADETVL